MGAAACRSSSKTRHAIRARRGMDSTCSRCWRSSRRCCAASMRRLAASCSAMASACSCAARSSAVSSLTGFSDALFCAEDRRPECGACWGSGMACGRGELGRPRTFGGIVRACAGNLESEAIWYCWQSLMLEQLPKLLVKKSLVVSYKIYASSVSNPRVKSIQMFSASCTKQIFLVDAGPGIAGLCHAGTCLRGNACNRRPSGRLPGSRPSL